MNPETDINVSESFFLNGKPIERQLGLKQILRDAVTGDTGEEWFDGDLQFPDINVPMPK